MDEDDLRSDLEAAFEEQEEEEISGEPEEAGGSEEDTEEPLGAEEAEGGEPEAEAEDQAMTPNQMRKRKARLRTTSLTTSLSPRPGTLKPENTGAVCPRI